MAIDVPNVKLLTARSDWVAEKSLPWLQQVQNVHSSHGAWPARTECRPLQVIPNRCRKSSPLRSPDVQGVTWRDVRTFVAPALTHGERFREHSFGLVVVHGIEEQLTDTTMWERF